MVRWQVRKWHPCRECLIHCESRFLKCRVLKRFLLGGKDSNSRGSLQQPPHHLAGPIWPTMSVAYNLNENQLGVGYFTRLGNQQGRRAKGDRCPLNKHPSPWERAVKALLRFRPQVSASRHRVSSTNQQCRAVCPDFVTRSKW